jgi:hypothetical protein
VENIKDGLAIQSARWVFFVSKLVCASRAVWCMVYVWLAVVVWVVRAA